MFFLLEQYLWEIPTVIISCPLVFLFLSHGVFFLNMIKLRSTASLSVLEMVYWSTNPRKTTRYWEKEDYNFKTVGVVFASIPLAIFNTLRNALWIIVTVISTSSNILPLSVRTRATTIVNAVNMRSKSEKALHSPKGSVNIAIGEKHRVVEENCETMLPHPYRWRREKYWMYWNDLAYEPRHFIEKDGSRVSVGRIRTSRPGEYTNSLGENVGFHIDTGDHVIMREVPGYDSSISFTNSEGVVVHIPLTCVEANNLVHWVWQHSTDTVYGALEGRDASIVDRNTWEMDIGLCIFGIVLRLYFFWYFKIIDDQGNERASDPVSIALLHLSIVAVVYTIRQSYLKDWVKYRGKRVSSELCYLTRPHRGSDRLARIMRTIINTEADEKDRAWMPPVFIGATNEDLFLHETWGIDCSNPQKWKVAQHSSVKENDSMNIKITISDFRETCRTPMAEHSLRGFEHRKYSTVGRK